MSRDPLRRAYDAVAPDYDRQVGGEAWMRASLWKRYAQTFHAGEHVLDLGCGTGTDAVFLGLSGLRVTAIDISPGMVEQARAKITRHGLDDSVRVLVHDIAGLVDLTDSLSDAPRAAGAPPFDGAIASFAVVNSLPPAGEPSLTQLGRDAARLLRPGAHLFLHLLTPWSLWDRTALLARGRWEKAWRPHQEWPSDYRVGNETIPHHLPRADDLYGDYFADSFHWRRSWALGLTRPPRHARAPAGLAQALGRLDEGIGWLRPLVFWGRFTLVDLVRRAE